MIYCDASLIVALFVEETRSDLAAAWIERQRQDDLVISRWVATEVASAFAMKHRMGVLSRDRRDVAAEAWRRTALGLAIVEVEAADFDRAATLVDAGSRGLRASDALHVAIAQRRSFALATLDKGMIEGARAVDVMIAAIGDT
ncbi:type II toxin-antitoxin system VapC family toxin [Sphingomonas sp. PB2P12]|uniref:type II toxin-antitoxin system VapC family toxin n=1 Tax=Sphingomonas sandaracina TaxID=3096157 RepID=UPI002FC87EC3